MASGSQKIYGDLVGDNFSSISNFSLPYYSSTNDSNSYLIRDGLLAFGNGSLYFKRSGSNPIKLLDNIEYEVLQNSITSINSINVSGSFVYLSYTNNSGSITNISSSIILPQPKTIASNYTATINDETIRVNASGSYINVTLPDSSTVTGKIYKIKKVDNTSNSVNILPSGSQLIDGYSYSSITQPNNSYTIQSYGSGWDIF